MNMVFPGDAYSSTTTPSVLVDETRLMLSDPIDRIGSAMIWDNRCLDPISINSVFFAFNVNLLAKSHMWTLFNSISKLSWISVAVDPLIVRLVSSANKAGIQESRHLGKSFM